MVRKEGEKFKPKKYLITGAQACYYENEDGDKLPFGGGREKAIPNWNLLEGFERFAKENEMELIIIPIAGKNTLENILHEELEKRNVFYGTSKILNTNLQLRDIVVPPQNVDPTTGKASLISKYNSSLIFAHTKQRFLPVPIFNADLPRYIYTTGAVTMPNYNIANHRGDTAERNHVFGGLVVEIIDETFYNLRNIRALKNGKFVDLGREYNGKNKSKKIKADSLILGDIHWGDHDKKAIKANYEMIDFFKPERLFLHDFFNGHSINHHESKNFLIKVREYARGRLDLEKEFSDCYKELINLSKAIGKKSDLFIVSSNHHAFLPKYINENAWVNKDLWNAKIGAHLFSKGISLTIKEKEIDDASYLVEEGLKRFGQIPSNVHFLRLKDNFKRYGYQLAIHGDKGNSGGRGGSAKSRRITGGGKSITGHSHCMEIFGDTYIVGTSTKLDLPYTLGYGSASIAANSVLYENGTVQLIKILNGKWKID